MISLSAILAIVITILAALHITYTVTINSIVPKINGAKKAAQAEAAKQAAINDAMIKLLASNGVDTTKLTTK